MRQKESKIKVSAKINVRPFKRLCLYYQTVASCNLGASWIPSAVAAAGSGAGWAGMARKKDEESTCRE